MIYLNTNLVLVLLGQTVSKIHSWHNNPYLKEARAFFYLNFFLRNWLTLIVGQFCFEQFIGNLRDDGKHALANPVYEKIEEIQERLYEIEEEQIQS